jgi:hypothetical protein
MCILITNCKKTDAFWEDGIEASSHTNTEPKFGRNCVSHVTVKWLPGLPTLTISKSHTGLDLFAVSAKYILSVLHKPTMHSACQQSKQSIKTDNSLPRMHENVMLGEQKDPQNCYNILSIEPAACFGLCTRQYEMYTRIIA